MKANPLKLISKKTPKSLLPNALTIFGVCLGLSSIKFALDQNYGMAIIAIGFAAINTTMDPNVAEKIIIKNAYQPKIIPPKIVKLEATGKEKETTKIYKIE